MIFSFPELQKQSWFAHWGQMNSDVLTGSANFCSNGTCQGSISPSLDTPKNVYLCFSWLGPESEITKLLIHQTNPTEYLFRENFILVFKVVSVGQLYLKARFDMRFLFVICVKFSFNLSTSTLFFTFYRPKMVPQYHRLTFLCGVSMFTQFQFFTALQFLPTLQRRLQG